MHRINMLKSKKGQMYIIMILVLCIAVYSVVISTNTITRVKRVSSFQEIVRNVHIETSEVSDETTELDETKQIEGFTDTILELVEYMKKADPEAGMLIMQEKAGETMVINNLDQGVYLFAHGKKRYLIGMEEEIKGTIGIDAVGGITFKVDLTGEDIGAKIGKGQKIGLAKTGQTYEITSKKPGKGGITLLAFKKEGSDVIVKGNKKELESYLAEMELS